MDTIPRHVAVALLTLIYTPSKRLIDQVGEHPAVLYVINEDPASITKPEIVDLQPYIDDRDVMKAVIEAHQDFDGGVVATVTVTEAWMVAFNKNSEEGEALRRGELDMLPSESPDRSEVVMFLLETADSKYAAHAEMIRDGDTVTLGPLQVMGGGVTGTDIDVELEQAEDLIHERNRSTQERGSRSP